MDMNKDIVTLPKRGLKTKPYNIGMNKRDLKKLTKGQLIKLLLKQQAQKPRNSVKHEDIIQSPRTGKPKPVPRNSVNEDIILPPPKGFRDRPPKPTRKPPLPPNDGFNFDDDIFQTENTSLGKFKIVGIRNGENKKFKSYTNEFRVKILKELDNDNEIYQIFQELVRTVKNRRKLSDNDLIRVVIQNEELPNAISTKFTKVESGGNLFHAIVLMKT